PLSFKEYMTAVPDKTNLPAKFQDYLRDSSFPYTLNLRGSPRQIYDYLESIYNAVILKDVIQRRKIADPVRLEKVLLFIFDIIGSETSIHNIKIKMENDRFKIDVQTIENYLSALIDSFILYRVGRYDIKGRELLKTNDKYYVADLGLRYFLLRRDGDFGHILENVVYLELLRRGYRVSVGKIGAKEVDFVARNAGGNVEYYQVSQSVLDPEVFAREVDPLDAIKDHYPKFILSMDYLNLSHKGIKHLNILDWLLE
ncbi:MAG: DUF4143 domain-containing protein, partial [Treponema sp.]|nr:DUF4143 domain-containing protein [Treponema sp.]